MSHSASSAAVVPGVRGAAGKWAWRDAWPVLVVALAYVPMLVVHARVLWARPHYQFFPLVFPGALALIWRYCRDLGEVQPGRRGPAVALAMVGWILLTFSIVMASTSAAAFGAQITLLAVVYALGGATLTRAFLPAWLFLWLAVPLPRSIDLRLVTGLQDLVSRWSSLFLDAFHELHVMEGNVVEIPGGRLLVDQACSGIYSLLTLMLGTVFYALWNRIGWFRGLFLIGAAVFWVVMGNVTRIVSIVLLSTRYNIDASVGKKHEALGLVIFVLMLLAVWSSDQFFEFLSVLARGFWKWIIGRRPRPADEEEVERVVAAPAGRTHLPSPRLTWAGSAFAALAFGICLIPQYAIPGVNWKEVLQTNDVYGPRFEKLVLESFPARFQSLDRVGFTTAHRKMDDSWGENSRLWFYRKNSGVVSVSLDYQFVDWHELALCYQSQGWEVTERRVEAPPSGGPKSLVVLDLVSPQGWYGYLVFGLYRSNGKPTDPPEAKSYLQYVVNQLAGWFNRSSRESQSVAALSYQLQVFVESEAPLSPSDREMIASLHETINGIVIRDGLGIAEVKP